MSRMLRCASIRGLSRFTIGVLAAGAVGLTGVAAAATVSSLGTARRTVSGKSETIVVDGRGVTVYELGGESLAHLECTSRACLNLWPALKVSSAGSRPQKGAGVPGTLSVLHRVRGGFYQLMLDRHPLYYFSGDGGRTGSTKGQGINSFGGSWHVVKANE